MESVKRYTAQIIGEAHAWEMVMGSDFSKVDAERRRLEVLLGDRSVHIVALNEDLDRVTAENEALQLLLNTRADLAHPVPPAGGDKPALYLDAKGFEIVTRCLTVSASIDVRAHHAGELFDHYRPDGLVPVYSEETVTRLQAEVERLGSIGRGQRKTIDNVQLQVERLQSELTKARELLRIGRAVVQGSEQKVSGVGAWLYAVDACLSSQSAPADTCCGSCPAGCVVQAADKGPTEISK